MGIVASKKAATRILTASNEALELLESNNVNTARAHLLAVVENPETMKLISDALKAAPLDMK
ncbi:hypothetical protein N7540_009768 [Penicillium herquei]|nr:hypothetical protein N7540_009768 [Penicillium herquei]